VPYYEKTFLGLAKGSVRTMIFLLAITNGIFYQFLVDIPPKVEFV
jgi:hypothetical protein